MQRFARLLARALIGLLTLGLLGFAVPPAPAEIVVVHDPSGDTRHHLGYDITRMRVQHKPKRIAVELNQSFTPHFYVIEVDVPGPKPWQYRISWGIYAPRKVFVAKRHSGRDVCERRTAHTSNDQTVLRFVLPRSCFDRPRALRLKAIAWDDEFGWSDRTRWTAWARKG